MNYIRIIVRSEVKASCCSFATSNFGLVILFIALRREFFDLVDHASGQMFPRLVVTCFFVSPS